MTHQPLGPRSDATAKAVGLVIGVAICIASAAFVVWAIYRVGRAL